ncbi:MAG: S8 family serine peptidase [Candidatus Geothermincolia bacterium]
MARKSWLSALAACVMALLLVPSTPAGREATARAAALVMPASPLRAAPEAGPGFADFVLKPLPGAAASVLENLSELKIPVVRRGLGGKLVVRLPEVLAAGVQDTLSALGGLEWMERDWPVTVAAIPDDPAFSQQWNLDTINAPEAWDIAGTGSGSVVVAVVDTGVAFNAPDLAGTRFLPGYDFYGDDASPDDANGHGTFVTEIIASGWNNNWRGAGISPGCSILPIQALSSSGKGSSSMVADGIMYAADVGARLINLSLSMEVSTPTDSLAMNEAVDYAWERGALCVVAAGNGHYDYLPLPASIPETLSVGATDRYDARASYSNCGAGLDLVAPGGTEKETRDAICQESFSGGRWGLQYWAGTSFAAPQVTATAALVLSRNPDLSPAELSGLITASCRDIGPAGWDAEFGNGLLDAAAAVTSAGGSSRWYFAEGTTRAGFEEYISILNPGGSPVLTYVDYFLADGRVVPTYYTLPARSRGTVLVNAVLGGGVDVSVRVTGTAPVVAERAMYFNYGGKWTGGTAVAGARHRSQLWFFAEGYTGAGFHEYLCLQNTGDAPAIVTVDYLFGGGSGRSASYRLAPNRRATLNVNAEAGSGRDVSMRVRSDQPIVAERPMYFNYRGVVDGGHCAVGATYASGEWHFAEGTTRAGFDQFLTIANPGEQAASVSVRYRFGKNQGSNVVQEVTVAAASRHTINVADEVGRGLDVSCTVLADRPVVVERPMYFTYGSWTGGHNVLGARYPATVWRFAEGTTRGGFESWITLANSSDSKARVTVNYIFAGGGEASGIYAVAANSRVTLNVSEQVGPGRDVALEVTSDIPIVVERPVYFSYGSWTGGHNVMGSTTQ